MQLGTKVKSTPQSIVAGHPKRTVNRAGGTAFTIDNPAQYLLATIGSAMFCEPKYYSDMNNVEELKQSGYNSKGLDEQAIRIIEACIAVCEGDSPRDVLALANWARTELMMRTTPCVMAAVASRCVSARKYIKAYVPKIAQRPDDIKQIAGAYRHLFGKSTPAQLKKGLAAALSRVNETGFLKYDGEGHPSWKDLLLFVDRKKDYPVSKELFEYLVNGKIVNPEKTPIIAAHKQLAQQKEFGPEAQRLARQCHVSHEVLVSQFGGKPEVYEALVGQMGYMALLRNLANFLTANVSSEAIGAVCNKLADRDQVLKSKQLPFRFYSARQALTAYDAGETWGKSKKHTRSFEAWDQRKKQEILSALDSAMGHAASNMPQFVGDTCIAIDISGSMANRLSEDSELLLVDAAAMLAALAVKASVGANGTVHCVAFATNPVLLNLSTQDSVLSLMQQIKRTDVGGHATYASKVVELLLQRKIKVDRFVLLSDMQCYGERVYIAPLFGNSGPGLFESLLNYRRIINPNCYFHSIDLCGQDGTSQMPEDDPKTHLVSGFHQSLFGHLIAFEQGPTEKAEKKTSSKDRQLPTLDYIRANY